MRKLGVSAAFLLAAFPLGACSSAESSDSASANETARSCSDEAASAAFDQMVNAPIIAGRSYGGFDIAGGNNWKGLSIDDLERTLCASHADDEDETTVSASWSSPVTGNGVLSVSYVKTTRKIDMIAMNPGYRGKLEFKSRAGGSFGAHTYSFGVSVPMLRDGQTFELDWQHIGPQINEIYDGVIATFAPEMPRVADCRASGDCVAAVSGGVGYFGVRPLGTYFQIPDTTIVQPGPSTPNQAYAFPVKMLPASHASANLKLDAEGPVVVASGLGDRGTTCTMKLGATYQSFVDGCVRVQDSSSASDVLQQKVEGSARRVVTRTSGTWMLDLDGTRPSFTSERFDETKPIATAKMNEMVFDVRSGIPLNDMMNGVKTLAATSALYREYARLVQASVRAALPNLGPAHAFGDPNCSMRDNHAPAAGCTGMESFIAPGPAEVAPTDTDPQVTAAMNANFPSALMPSSSLRVMFSDDDAGYRLFKDTADHVAKVTQHGDTVGDPAIYLKIYAQALVDTLGGGLPADGDLTITYPQADLANVRFKDKLEFEVLRDEANLQSMTFR